MEIKNETFQVMQRKTHTLGNTNKSGISNAEPNAAAAQDKNFAEDKKAMDIHHAEFYNADSNTEQTREGITHKNHEGRGVLKGKSEFNKSNSGRMI